MQITTVDAADTERLLALAVAKENIKKIQHILDNKHSPADQIKAIRKLLVAPTDPPASEGAAE